MKELRYTLLCDGSSDRALIPILTWLLKQHGIRCPIEPEWADLGRLRRAEKYFKLPERIRWSLDLYPCDLLFVHRDAEKEPHYKRVAEIRQAVKQVKEWRIETTICVVPVRMLEAWLLFDEAALRYAAGNPRGRQRLKLPALNKLEKLPNPKHNLYELLRQASGLSGRRRKKLSVRAGVHRVAQAITDFSPLRALPAFQALETEVEAFVKAQGSDFEPSLN